MESSNPRECRFAARSRAPPKPKGIVRDMSGKGPTEARFMTEIEILRSSVAAVGRAKLKHSLVDALSEMDHGFAKIALSRGYISLADWRAAISDQRRGHGGHPRTLPGLLLEKGLISFGEIESVLQELLDTSEHPA